MESFTFKGINSNSLGIIVKEMPLVPRAERNIETINVNGRNRPLHIDNKNYLLKSYSIVCLIKEKEHIDDICSLFVGTGQLTLSKYPNRVFNATIKNQIDFKNYLNYLNEFPLQFELDPISYSSTSTIEELTSSGSITVDGNTDSYPKITITGTGQVTVNGYSFTVSESGVTIDSDLMICYNGTTAKNDKVTLSEFPKLKPGSNTISLPNTVTKIKIEYNSGWL